MQFLYLMMISSQSLNNDFIHFIVVTLGTGVFPRISTKLSMFDYWTIIHQKLCNNINDCVCYFDTHERLLIKKKKTRNKPWKHIYIEPNKHRRSILQIDGSIVMSVLLRRVNNSLVNLCKLQDFTKFHY